MLRDEAGYTGTISLGEFYIRRACRLLPALGAFLAGIALLRLMGLIADVPVSDFVEAIFYVRNIFGHSQSLAHLWRPRWNGRRSWLLLGDRHSTPGIVFTEAPGSAFVVYLALRSSASPLSA